MRQLTAEHYHALAAKRGFECFGDIPGSTTRIKANWRCPQGHEWQAVYDSIKAGSGCPHCSHNPPKYAADYHRMAQERGVEWGGGLLPPNVKTKTTWRCPQGHEWIAAYENLQMGSRCPHCSNRVPKTADDYQSIAAMRGFEWTALTIPPDTMSKTTWMCPQKHEWSASFNVIRRGSGCPFCAHTLKKIAANYHDLAKLRGFEWIDNDIPRNVHSLATWRCSKGNEWKSTWDNIHRGNGCPHCVDMVNGAYVSNPQRKLHQMLGGELNYPIRRYRLDIALISDELRICIEYDCAYWHDPVRDARRDKYLLSHGWHILRIKSRNLLPAPDQLETALNRLRGGETYAEIILPDWQE